MTVFSNQIIISRKQLWSLKFLQAVELFKQFCINQKKY